MNEFLKSNFASFKSSFEEYMDCSLCLWIEDNIVIKENSKSDIAIDLPKWFLCLSLLKNPERAVVQKCNTLFNNPNNLNRRTPHQYLCDQVVGFLKEVYHINRLQLKHPEITFFLNGSEINTKNKKREIYILGAKKRDIDLKAEYKGVTKDFHLKANNTFIQRPKITFRGGRTPEINNIKNNKSKVHILVDENKYFCMSKLISCKECIKNESFIEDPYEQNLWGGKGAYRIHFNDNILDYAVKY